MTITLELSTEQERRLEEGTARRDADVVRNVLFQAVNDAVPKLLLRQGQQLDPTEFRSFLDSLASDFADSPALSDEAVSRSSIYGDHP